MIVDPSDFQKYVEKATANKGRGQEGVVYALLAIAYALRLIAYAIHSLKPDDR